MFHEKNCKMSHFTKNLAFKGLWQVLVYCRFHDTQICNKDLTVYQPGLPQVPLQTLCTTYIYPVLQKVDNRESLRDCKAKEFNMFYNRFASLFLSISMGSARLQKVVSTQLPQQLLAPLHHL